MGETGVKPSTSLSNELSLHWAQSTAAMQTYRPREKTTLNFSREAGSSHFLCENSQLLINSNSEENSMWEK